MNDMTPDFDPYNPYGYRDEIPGWDKMTDEEREQTAHTHLLFGCATYAVAFAVALLLCWIFCGCTTTKYVPVIEYHTDTLIHTQHHRDSVYVHDSIRVSEKGDTIRIERWHTRYRDRWHTDTVYIAKTDTIPAPYPVEKKVEVPARLTWWQQTRMHAGGIVIFLLIIFVVRKIYVTLHPRL